MLLKCFCFLSLQDDKNECSAYDDTSAVDTAQSEDEQEQRRQKKRKRDDNFLYEGERLSSGLYQCNLEYPEKLSSLA